MQNPKTEASTAPPLPLFSLRHHDIITLNHGAANIT